MTIIRNDLLQAARHVAANACDEVEVSGSPFFCEELLELLHGLRVPAVHAPLEIIPQFFDRIELGTPCGSLDEVNAVTFEPESTRTSSMNRPVILLKPPLSFGPKLMR